MVFDSVTPDFAKLPTPDVTPPGRRNGPRGLSYGQELRNLIRSMNVGSTIAPQHLSAYHTAIRIHDDILGVESNLIDVGYGVSQVIPVIAGCANRATGPVLVEQPEIHLHPRAQGELARTIARASAYKQVIVETHSEHIVNGIRKLIASGTMRPEDVAIQYVSRSDRGCDATEIGIDKFGEFTSEWPEGFFDERFQDTVELLRLKAERKATRGKK